MQGSVFSFREGFHISFSSFGGGLQNGVFIGAGRAELGLAVWAAEFGPAFDFADRCR